MFKFSITIYKTFDGRTWSSHSEPVGSARRLADAKVALEEWFAARQDNQFRPIEGRVWSRSNRIHVFDGRKWSVV